MAIGVRWRKVRGDLGQYRARTALVVASALSIPASRVLSDALGQAFVQRPLAFEISAQGFVLWFIVVFWLAVVGSLLPAWRAARTSVREVLAAAAAKKQADEQVAVSEANLDGAQAALETARDNNSREDEATAARNAARAQVRVAKAAATGAAEGVTAAQADACRAESAVASLELARAEPRDGGAHRRVW
jgi:hypothetical protein